MIIFQVIPHKNLRNYHNEKLVNGFSEFSKRFFNRLKLNNKNIKIIDLDYINFKLYLSLNNISFFISCPKNKKEYFKSKIESSWDKITIIELEKYPFEFDLRKIVISELSYKRHDIFSLRTDKDITYPLRSLFTLTNEFKINDFVLIDIFGIPYKRHYWDYEAKLTYDKFKKGMMPRKINSINNNIIQYLGLGMNLGFGLLNDVLSEITNNKRKSNGSYVDNEVRLLMQQGLSNSTIQKINSEVLKTRISIISQSDNIERAKINNSAISGCYKELSTIENELANKVIESSERNLNYIINNKGNLIDFNYNKCSIFEWSKLTQIATAELQKDFDQIEKINRIESKLPNELFHNDGIEFCKVTEKGVTRIAKIPINDYDILSMPWLSFGMMRTGKSEGFGNNLALGFIKKGFSAFVLETNDGLSLDALRDSLPLDYPDEKIIEVDLGNLHYPIALNWNDSLSRSFNSDDEVEKLKIAEKLNAHIVSFINNLANEKFSDKMSYYLNVGKSVLVDSNKGLLDMMLALTSCSYREELMKENYIKEQVEIYEILKVLQSKSVSNTDLSTIEPILTRLNILIGNRFLANFFLQKPKLNGLDFRKYMDNKNGGYGYCVLIRIPKAEFGSVDVVNIIASFMISKIWTCALSRIDISKDKRKPFCFIADEPHQYIQGSGNIYKEAGVESAKYRMKLIWLAHSLGQFGEFKSSLTSGGCQITAYKTKSFKEFKELESEFKEFDIKELYEDIPVRWVAVNKIYLPGCDDVPSFIGDMLKPPKKIKDRSYRKLECSKQFGRSFKEVVDYINKNRDRRKLDEEWLERMRKLKEIEKEEDKELKKEIKKELKKVGRPAGRKVKIYK